MHQNQQMQPHVGRRSVVDLIGYKEKETWREVENLALEDTLCALL
jgi:hypothetical protein